MAKKITAKEVLALSPDKLRKMSQAQLKDALKAVTGQANKRLSRLEKMAEENENFFSPALYRRQIRAESGKLSSVKFNYKPSYSGKNDETIIDAYINAIKDRKVFLNTYTSTVGASKKWEDQAVSDLQIDEARAFEVLDLLAEENEGMRNTIYNNHQEIEFAELVITQNGFGRIEELARDFIEGKANQNNGEPNTEKYNALR